MPFRKKALYYGLMLLLTLLALEGMARIAWSAAYGQGTGGVPSGTPGNSALPPPPDRLATLSRIAARNRISHPFYSYANPAPGSGLNAMPPRPRREDTVVIALLGGSVAEEVRPFLQRELNRWFAANRLPSQPLVRALAFNSYKQPQQAIVLANTLLLGGEFDLIVNLDGFNESGALGETFAKDLFPFFPYRWSSRVNLTSGELLLAGKIGVLRREQARLAAVRETSLLRWSALFRLANRYRQERIAAQIIRLNYDLSGRAAGYNLEKHGPRSWLDSPAEIQPAAARFWYRGSVALNRLAERAGADYYHFLQPNQYVPGAKPLSSRELKDFYDPLAPSKSVVEKAYPLLQGFGLALQSQGINYFDLTGIFADHPETLYNDKCCHLNGRGNELLAAAMAQRLEPALRRRVAASPYRPAFAFAAARPPGERGAAPEAREFTVALSEDGKELRYFRPDCIPEDTKPAFFLNIVPEEAADLPPRRREYGFDQRVFRFAEAGGVFKPWQCVLLIRLPDYPIAEIRAGQVNRWQVRRYPPAAPQRLRAAYAALSPEQLVAQDVFDLYIADNRLLYRREPCAATDTAAAFFLHIIPENKSDLPAERRAAGFANQGFDFARRGSHFAGKCLAAVPLPDYPLKELRTGQHSPGPGDLWSVELVAIPNLDQLRADYAALAGVQPAARDYFALYWRDNQLLYRRETCAAADTAAGFFLHLVPENPADLPAERSAAGFDDRGFAFARQGGHFDGKCLAAVPLPNYPIKAMRTGQYVPGQGDLWSVELRAAPWPNAE